MPKGNLVSLSESMSFMKNSELDCTKHESVQPRKWRKIDDVATSSVHQANE